MSDTPKISYETTSGAEQATPTPSKTGGGTLDNIKLVMDSGGVKGTLVKFGVWFCLPLVIVVTIAYFLYTSFFGRRATIDARNSTNNSVQYKDENTGWNVQVNDINNSANVQDDIDKFKIVADKIKALYK